MIQPVQFAADINGVNWDGTTFRLSEQKGRVAVVFFGYTFCPDVCPMSLSKMKTLYQKLGEKAQEVAVIFVSVDPERDTPEKLAGYVPLFDRRFYGVHLDAEQLEAAQQAFNLTVEKRYPQGNRSSLNSYFMDHTGSFFVVDQDGRLRLRFPADAAAEAMFSDIERLLQG